MVQVMNSEFYEVYVDSDCVGKYMPLQYALMLIKASYSEFYAEPGLEIKIKKMVLGTESTDDVITKETINE